ncbi:UbiH/UbiF family hydroxylase [Silvimonas amylolytica]|uniref:Ubiquinone biosynthesis hydroxylase UbiH n=1 Tax=Silvimonas amylolytica TaxID=449663 RepID=A0ABQ2PLQ5_9NEIS|nr:UbiH/UbiF family hydroxylase [Silvimonas amylolytica]GGP26199.1 ubiquinone biosynthesis hydroxylase UbiH [Silvimonas amylolytica]
MKFHDADVLIVGGGLVGCALACALKDTPLQVTLVDSHPPAQSWDAATWDSRIYAISPASRRFLMQIGAWQRMDASRLQSVGQMRIAGDDGRAELAFTAVEARTDELARIVESRELQRALWQAASESPNVTLIAPAQPSALHDEPDGGKLLALSHGPRLSARLVIGADGVQSWVRSQAGIEEKTTPYNQWGVVANFECEKPHLATASQWFFEDGVLAFLPLAGQRMSMVWSCGEVRKNALLSLSADALCQEVARAGQNRLGELNVISPAAAFPLRLMHVADLVKPALALIGDAAHAVHPLAGQGVNLGFGDAMELARILKAEPASRCGDYLVLRRYERARRENVLLMQGVTHGLQKLFNNTNPVLRILRNTGLGLTDQWAWLKHRLIQHAMNA